MSAGVGGIESHIASHLDPADLGPDLRECEWCAREVPISSVRGLSIPDEPCPEDLLWLCPNCLPENDRYLTSENP